jgi:tetratricopeptide (TPR) repeat protein
MSQMGSRFGSKRFEADEYYRQALEVYRKKKDAVTLESAIRHIDDAIRIYARSEYYAARGLFYLDSGNASKAQGDFEQALKLFPMEMLAHYGRGMIAYDDRNWDEAIAHFADAYRADPNRPETVYYLALAYQRKGENQIARQVMEVAHNLFPESDKRRRDAYNWMRELDKLLKQK